MARVNKQEGEAEADPKQMKRTFSAPGLSREGEDGLPLVRIGICAMDKKAKSKQMMNIVDRLKRYGEFDILLFGDDTICNKPVEEWPVVDCLLTWHSEGFPLRKAQQYVALRRPYLVNDVNAQDILLDRRRVYRKLKESNIPVPHHIIVDRSGLPPGADLEGFVETEDYVELGGVRIQKPFVEKPASGEDHNVYIYYPHSMGGGVKKLFRKVDNRSGDYDPTHPGTVRRKGSYIYEEFLATGGTDVKVYTVGPRYAHAEARRSPVVDGKVLRTPDGKEVRFPVLLSPQEKEIARMVCLAFGQRVCGFDLLRSERGRSYVCDVNGWSFVKNSYKYYDDAAGILRMIILSACQPHRLMVAPPQPLSISDAEFRGNVDPSCYGIPAMGSYDDVRSPLKVAEDAIMGGGAESRVHPDEELRCVLAVVRHGDRTPKQKMKMKVTQAPLLDLMHKYLDSKGKQAKLKSPNELQELLDVTRQLLDELEARQRGSAAGTAAAGSPAAGSTAGAAGTAPAAGAAGTAGGSGGGGAGEGAAGGGAPHGQQAQQAPQAPAPGLDPDNDEFREKFRIMKTVLEQGGQFAGINRKVQLKPVKWSSPEEGSGEAPRVTEALLILKHGGVLTHAGRQQAESLGSLFRNIMYPQHGQAGGGLLRLHSTYRHDLKIYSSDEGRVQTSAAAFTKGLLDLQYHHNEGRVQTSAAAFTKGLLDLQYHHNEGRVQTSAAAFTKGLLDLEGNALTPILVSLVKKDAGMLDAFGKGASEDIRLAKQELYAQMTFDPDTHVSMYAEPQITTPFVSPPLSPKLEPGRPSGASDDGIPPLASAPASAAGSRGDLSALGLAAVSPSRLASYTSMSSAEGPRGLPGASANYSYDSEAGGGEPGASNIPGRPSIFPMPPNPLALLRKLYNLLKVLVDRLRQKCLEVFKSINRPQNFSPLAQVLVDQLRQKCLAVFVNVLVDQLRQKCLEEPRSEDRPRGYSALTQDPKTEWKLEDGKPCSGEKLLLMFDRWRKLLKAFYHDKKHHFDISKVPDIYDAAKYDAIHNAHLGVDLKELYQTAKILADAVIPNEYGIDPRGKLRIGSMICSQLLGKLLADLASMREESMATAGLQHADDSSQYDYTDFKSLTLDDQPPARPSPSAAQRAQQAPAPDGSQQGPQLPRGRDKEGAGAGGEGREGDPDGVVGQEPDDDSRPLHRLCPTYAQASSLHDINSPFRHVRTRIYFTSESHMHSLMNVLRYCHLGMEGEDGLMSEEGQRLLPDPQASIPRMEGEEGLLSEEGQRLLHENRELDYMTHWVLRMYENKTLPLEDPSRFKVR
ncbi:hypothetical protein N2152v2_010885 [Parachlorella kessleri]